MKAADSQNCWNFFNAENINNLLRPTFNMGFSAILNADISKLFGAKPMTSILSNKITISSMYPSGQRIGVFYTINQDNQEELNKSSESDTSVSPSSTLFLETDMSGHVTGEAKYGVFRNLLTKVWGQRAASQSVLNALMEWSGSNFNARAMTSLKTHTRASFTLDHVYRWSDHWTYGSQLSFGGADDALPDNYLSQIYNTLMYVSLVRFDDESITVSASMNQYFNGILRFQRRINEILTVGTELSVDPRNKMVKTTWMHKIVLNDEAEVHGEIDTNGMVIGRFQKTLMPSFAVAISALVNHRTNQFGLGVELIYGVINNYQNQLPPSYTFTK